MMPNHFDPHGHRRTGSGGFTLVELLVVISIIATLIAILLPALRKVRETTNIAICASNEHQLSLAIHAWSADSDGELPTKSSYADGSVLNRGMRNRIDFWTQLYPSYAPEKDAWYCPEGFFFHDEIPPPAVGFIGTWWDFDDTITSGNAGFTYAIYSNAPDYSAWAPDASPIPERAEDPGEWILVNDYTVWQVSSNWYALGNHPGFAPLWVNYSGVITPQGVNVGTLDGSVNWRPEPSLKQGYPGAGGQPHDYKLME